MAKRRKRTHYEFKPDAQGVPLHKRLKLTLLQKKQVLQWSLNALLCLFLLVIQDVVMSRFSFRGATTDLVPGILILITVMSDVYVGSLFVLIGSMLYTFAGSAPGPYAIAYLTVVAVAVTVFRQRCWRRGFRSSTLCAGLGLFLYEMAVFLTGIFLGLTHWGRFGVFLMTWALTFLVMAALYPLLLRIQRIGGEIWKE